MRRDFERTIAFQLLLALLLSSAPAALASTGSASRLTKQVVAALNVTQLQYKDWAAGGQDALSYVAQLNANFDLKDTRMSWRFVGKFAFGQTKLDGESLRNSTDQIDMDLSMSYRIDKHINPFIGATLRTQFATGYDYRKEPPVPRSAFRDPLYMTQTIGANLATEKYFRSRLGCGFKETYTRKYTQYSDDPRTPEIEKRKIETGIQSTSSWTLKLGTQLVYNGRLRMFSTFEHIDVVDVIWDNVWTAQVAKYVAVNLTVNVLYDKDVSKRTQIKQSLAIGLTYNLF